MADPTPPLDPNASYGDPFLIEKPGDLPPNVKPPAGVVIGMGNGQYYAYKHTFADGHTVIQWFERGSGDGANDDVAFETPGPTAVDIKDKFDQKQKEQAKEQAAQAARGDQEGDTRGSQTGPTREVYRGGKWVVEQNPVYQAPPAQTAPSAPPTEKDQGGRHYVWQPNPGGPTAGGQWVDTGPAAPESSKPPTERVNPADPTRRQVWNPQANNGTGAWEDGGLVAQDASKPPTERVDPGDPTKRQTWNPQANNGKGAWEESGTVAKEPSKPTQAPDGTWGYWDTTKTPPAWVPIQGGPAGEAPKPVNVNGTWGTWKPDAAGGAPTFVPAENVPVKPEDQPVPRGAPTFTPDYTQDDLGLSNYNEQLLQAQQSGLITKPQGAALLEQAGYLATQTATHGSTLRSQGLTQRGQDINEVQSRRTFQGTGFDNLFQNLLSAAPHMGRGHGGIIGDAFAEALAGRQAYAANVGGFQDIPQVQGISPAVQAARTSAAAPAAAQTTVAPDGTVTINHTPPAPAASQNPPGVRTGAEMTGHGTDGPPPPVFRPTPPDAGDAPVAPDAAPLGQVPGSYMRPQPPTFDPSPLIQQWRAQGISDDVIALALKNHEMEMGPVGRLAA